MTAALHKRYQYPAHAAAAKLQCCWCLLALLTVSPLLAAGMMIMPKR